MKRLVIAMVLAGLLLPMMPMAVSADSGVTVVDKTGDGNWIDENTWQVEIFPGEVRSTTLTLYNSSNSLLDVEITIIPDSLDNGNLVFRLDRIDFTISGKAYEKVTLSVGATGGATPGTYTTELTIKSEVPLEPSPALGISMFALYNLTIKNITEDSAYILWETSRPTTSELIYWAVSKIMIRHETRTSKHIVHLEELRDNTTYHFEITCRDQYGLRKSVTGGFTTLKKEIAIPEPEEPDVPPVEPEEPIEPEEEEPEVIEPEEEEPIEPEEPEEPTKPEELVPIEEPSRWSLLDSILAGLVLVALGLVIWQRQRQRRRA